MNRDAALSYIVSNWRVRRRLPRLTALAVSRGFIVSDVHEDDAPRPRRLTRQEQLEGLADRGVDTWEEYHNER